MCPILWEHYKRILIPYGSTFIVYVFLSLALAAKCIFNSIFVYVYFQPHQLVIG